MDMTMVDLTDIGPEPQPGDEVVLIGRQGEEDICVDDIAAWGGTISYEVLTGVGKRVARLYLRDGRITTLKTLLGVYSAGSE
jgi:alanine racemase